MNTKSPFRIVLLALLLGGFCAVQAFDAEDYFGDPTLNLYSDDIGFCFRITITVRDENDKSVTVDTLFFGNVADRAEKYNPDINSELLEVQGTNFSYFWEAPNAKWMSCFYESEQNADWTLLIKNSGTLTVTRLGPADKVIPANAALNITAASQTGTTYAIVDNLSFAVLAGQTWNISYIHKVRSDIPKSVTYTFTPGWNLLSLPIVIYDKQPGENIGWDALLALRPLAFSGKTFVRCDDIGCGEAFWVFYKGQLADDDNKLTIAGFEPLPSEWPVPITTGWNFLGPRQGATNIFGWNNAGRSYQPIAEATDTTKGFWSR